MDNGFKGFTSNFEVVQDSMTKTREKNPQLGRKDIIHDFPTRQKEKIDGFNSESVRFYLIVPAVRFKFLS